MSRLGIPFGLAIFVGGAVAGVFGALVALPALRVSGHYLAIATLAFAILVQQVLFEWESVTGGRQGLAVPRPSVAGHELRKRLLVLLLPARAIRRLRLDDAQFAHLVYRTLAGGASHERGRRACAGISRARHIILAFALSAFLTGVSGALYGSLIGRLSTETFSLSASLSFLTMAVIGGLGSEVGALLGAAFLAAAPEVLRQFKDARDGDLRRDPGPVHAFPAGRAGGHRTAMDLLEIEDLSIAFAGLRALERVSFRVREGEILGLIGPNGAGKSTLLNCVSRVHAPTRGSVRFAARMC